MKDDRIKKGGVEKWFPVIGYPGYEISDKGRVKSLKKGNERIMKTTGGIAVLYREKKQYTYKVERIYFAASRGIDLDKLKGYYVLGNNLNELELMTLSDMIQRIREKSIKNKDTSKIEASYEESKMVIEMVLCYYRTGDINPIANYINSLEKEMKGYIYNNKYSMNQGAIEECWQYAVESVLAGIVKRKIMVPYMKLYLKKTCRNFFVIRRREARSLLSCDVPGTSLNQDYY